MYVYAVSNYVKHLKEKTEDKKKLLSTKFARTDNFIDLALYGAEQCLANYKIDKDSTIYVASRNGNMNSTLKVMHAIFLNKQLPMPFHFLNSVNAATLFYVAKSFSIEGKTLFVDTFESAIPQAFSDTKQGKDVLLGYVEEVLDSHEEHQKRFSCIAKEESRWILLSEEKKTTLKPLAQIVDIVFTREKKKHEIEELFNFLDCPHDFNVFYFKGDYISFTVQGL